MKTKVYVTRLLPKEAMDKILSVSDVELWKGDLPPPREILAEKVRGVDGLLCLLTERVDADLMNHSPKLRVISNYAVGYDNIDLAEATRRGIIVGNTPGVLTETTADFAWALLMASARRIAEGDRQVRSGRWKTWGPMMLLGQDIYEGTLGIVGLGRIGTAVARRAKGFGVKVLYADSSRKMELETELGVSYVKLGQLLAESDFITIHTNLTPETHHLIGKDELAKMKKTSVLINTARGQIVDTLALYAALRDRKIAYAALDVTEPEPLPANHPLLTLDNIIVTPHIASASTVTRTKMALMAADNLIAGLSGKMPPYPVNPEVMRQPQSKEAESGSI